jgi:hypothetical protein
MGCNNGVDNRKKKGIMSAAAFFITISAFAIAHIFLVNNIRTRSVTSETLLSNRIFYIYDSIRSSAGRMIEVELGNITYLTTMNVSVEDGDNSSYVEFTEKFPQDATDFKADMSKYDDFAESYLNETNINVDTDIDQIAEKMEWEIEPYGIKYTHTDNWASGDKRQFEVIPEEGADDITGYWLTIQLLNNWSVMPETEAWGPLKAGDLIVNMTTISDGGSPMHSTEESVSRTEKSTFKIDCNLTNSSGTFIGWVRAIISDEYESGLLFQMHLVDALITTGLKLTDIPGSTRVHLPDGKINVMETLYNIEKNGTVDII